MSRVGKKPVGIPSGVTANIEGQTIKVKGPKGALQVVLHGDVSAKLEGGGVRVDPRNETQQARAMWGTYRALVAKVIEGVTIAVPKPTEVVITGVDAQKVGQAAAEIRAFRKPEPYKGKGVKYSGEFIFRKEGKKK